MFSKKTFVSISYTSFAESLLLYLNSIVFRIDDYNSFILRKVWFMCQISSMLYKSIVQSLLNVQRKPLYLINLFLKFNIT